MSDPSIYAGISEVFDVLSTELSNLKVHDHIPVQDLADKIEKDCPSTPASYLPNMIRLFVKSTKGKYTIELGREGGVYFGGRAPKETKPRCETCNQVLRPAKLEVESPISSSEAVEEKEISP